MAYIKPITSKELNKLTEEVRAAGYKPLTELARIQSIAEWLIVPNNLANAGKILTLKEVNEFRVKQFGLDAPLITQGEYRKALSDLRNAIGDFTSIERYEEDFEEGVKDIVDRAEEFYGVEIDFGGFTHSQITDIIRMSSTSRRGADSNGDFYKNIQRYTEEVRSGNLVI